MVCTLNIKMDAVCLAAVLFIGGCLLCSLPITTSLPFFIQYKNIGKKDLLIENIDTGCGCIINETFFLSVVPGDSAYINLAFKPQSGGYVERRMAIYFQGYDNPLDITVKAFAVDSVR